jgi:hypothetical protein
MNIQPVQPGHPSEQVFGQPTHHMEPGIISPSTETGEQIPETGAPRRSSFPSPHRDNCCGIFRTCHSFLCRLRHRESQRDIRDVRTRPRNCYRHHDSDRNHSVILPSGNGRNNSQTSANRRNTSLERVRRLVTHRLDRSLHLGLHHPTACSTCCHGSSSITTRNNRRCQRTTNSCESVRAQHHHPRRIRHRKTQNTRPTYLGI